MFSYGSGLTATMFSFRLNEGQQPFSLSNIAAVMNVADKLKSRHEVYLFSFWFFVLSNANMCVLCGELTRTSFLVFTFHK